jgi:hypothetical protein
VLREIEKDKMGISTWLRVRGEKRGNELCKGNSIIRMLSGERRVASKIMKFVKGRALANRCHEGGVWTLHAYESKNLMLGKQHNGQKRIMNTIIIRVQSITKHGSIVMGHALEDGHWYHILKSWGI